MENESKESSENYVKPFTDDVKVEIVCLDCLEVLWVARASQILEPRVSCPFRSGGNCVLKSKGCNCG